MKKLKEVKIIDSIYPNTGIAVHEDIKNKIAVKNALLGQTVSVKPGKNKSDYKIAKLYEIIEKSDIETNEGCIHKEECGGCVYQSLTYEDEIDYKYSQIKKLYGEKNITVDKVIESPSHVEYRNKMEYTFGDSYKGSELALGLHKKNRFYEIVNNDKCLIVHPDFNILKIAIREYFKNKGMTHFHKRTHEGNLRHLVIRRSTLGEILINLVITWDTIIDKKEFIEYILDLEIEGSVKSIFITYNDSPSDAVVAERIEKIYGEDYIIEEISDLKFKITPFSFFQTNTKSAERLYKEALALIPDLDEKIVFDLYSGTGTITQILARNAKKVYGIEIIEEAVESAKESARDNNIENVEFLAGDVFEKIEELEVHPEIIVLDPPREGILPKTLIKLINIKPDKFLYISCNPKTQVRDLDEFIKNGYDIEKTLMVDQFPRTSHVETIVLMSRK